jgi:hypothetical protein
MARQLLQQIQYPEYPRVRLGDRRAFVTGVAEMVAEQRIEERRLFELMSPVFDKGGKNAPRGPQGFRLTPELISFQ